MTRPTKMEVNCTTGVTQILELTDQEMAQMEKDAIASKAAREAREAEAEAKATAKASAHAKLKALGLTEDEVTALI